MIAAFFSSVLYQLSRARNRPVVAACFVLAFALGIANYFLWQQREAAVRQHADVRQKGEFMLRSLTDRTRIEADLGALETAMAQIEENVIDEPSMEVNLGYFYRLERTNRVRLGRLHQLSANPTAEGAKFKAVPFSMQVIGSYGNTMAFLRALETGPRVLRIRHSDFQRGEEGDPDLTLDLTVDVLSKI